MENLPTEKMLDAFDLRILDALQKDNSTPMRHIGEQVNLSTAAVHRRVSRLKAEGVIIGNHAALDSEKIGNPITVIVEVHIESERIDLLDKAKRSFLSADEVQQCYYVAGDADFLLIVVVGNMKQYEALTRRLFFENHNVRHFRTLVVLDKIKASLAQPLSL